MPRYHMTGVPMNSALVYFTPGGVGGWEVLHQIFGTRYSTHKNGPNWI